MINAGLEYDFLLQTWQCSITLIIKYLSNLDIIKAFHIGEMTNSVLWNIFVVLIEF